MSGASNAIFPKKDTPTMELPAPIEEPELIQEDASTAGKKKKRAELLKSGKSSTLMAGIQARLKSRLGE